MTPPHITDGIRCCNLTYLFDPKYDIPTKDKCWCYAVILERDIDEINLSNARLICSWVTVTDSVSKGCLWDHNFHVIFVDILRTCRNKEAIVLDGGEDKEV